MLMSVNFFLLFMLFYVISDNPEMCMNLCLLQSKFNDLDPELLSAEVTKYGKYVNQLEKGLPPNSVVPHLKTSVDTMREKVGSD